MPDFPLIDAHVHLYDPAAISYPWMQDAPALNALHGPAEFTVATGGVAVDGLIFVEVDAATVYSRVKALAAAQSADITRRVSGEGVQIIRGAGRFAGPGGIEVVSADGVEELADLQEGLDGKDIDALYDGGFAGIRGGHDQRANAGGASGDRDGEHALYGAEGAV